MGQKSRTIIKPVSIETNCFSPFQLQNTDSALISILKVISAPLTVYQIRFLIPKNLAEEENPSEAVLETIKKSISNPNPSHLYRLPTPQAPVVRPAPVPNTARLSAGEYKMPLRNASNVIMIGISCHDNDSKKDVSKWHLSVICIFSATSTSGYSTRSIPTVIT